MTPTGLDLGSKNEVFGDAAKRTLTAGGLGSVGEKAAAALADFVVLDMFATYCTDRNDQGARSRSPSVRRSGSIASACESGRRLVRRPFFRQTTLPTEHRSSIQGKC